MRSIRKTLLALIGLGLVALLAAACGSSGSSGGSSGGSGGGSASATSPSGAPTSGPGLTQPTNPSGTKLSGGTVTFTEGPSAAPNYIFPMTNPQVCSTANLNQLSYMMYRPLYWFGRNYRPTVDYDYSVGGQPKFSNGGKTVTVTLKSWKWSDGEPVTARDVEFYINMYKADPAKNYCGYVPGYFPDNLSSVSASGQTLTLTFNKAYNPEWIQYNELSQLFPLPLAWDRTSLSAPAPKSDNGHLPDTSKSGAEAVYTFLDTQAKSVGSWATSPIWSVVDGPFKLQSFTNTGQATLVPNPSYSGSPKPTISKLVELPFTDDTSEFNEERSGGASAVTIANVPSQYAPQISALKAEGYVYNQASEYSFNYFPLNLHNPTMGPVFSQTYFRQAFQHLVDQQGWVNAFLDKTANPTYSPIPPAPPSPLVSFNASSNPFPFSTATAASILKAHGWNVVPGGQTTCKTPSLCGAGIKAGQPIAFNIDYQAGVAAVKSEMNDLQAQAKKVGININLTSHPFATVIGTATACMPNQPTCKWTAENWGAGWVYGPDYLPTGESLFQTGAVANYGSYGDAKATNLITQTITGPAGQEKQALSQYAQYMEQQVPVVFGPTSLGTYEGDAGQMISAKLGGYTANALGLMNPEDWYLVK